MKRNISISAIFVLFFFTLGIAIEKKKNDIREARKTEVVTILRDLTRNGAPVNVSTVSKQTFSDRIQVSFTPCSGGLCFYSTKEIRKKLRVGLRVFEVSTDNIIGHISHLSSNPSITDGLFEARIIHIPHNKSHISTGTVEISKLKNVIVAPLNSIEYRESNPFVYIVGEDGKYELRSVALGAQNSSQVLILSGLDVGEQIIVKGQSLIKRYGKINILEVRNSND